MKLTAGEQETIIGYNKKDNEAVVYTHSKSLIKKLLGYCSDYPDKYQLKTEDEHSKTFIIPKRYVSIRRPIELSPRQRENLKPNLSKVTIP